MCPRRRRPLTSLSLRTRLPAEEAFSTSPVTTDDVVQFARRTPGGRALGPDEVPVEALRVRCVAVQVARVMNRMLAGDLAPSEWTFVHIVPIPKKLGTTRKEDDRGSSIMSCAANRPFNRLKGSERSERAERVPVPPRQ